MSQAAQRNYRKIRIGLVVSDRMDQSIIVRVDRTMKHPLYKKTVLRSAKLYAHDGQNEARIGDTVRLMETRPLSKSKRWRLVDVVEKAK